MDDLSGLDWNSTRSSARPSLQPTPSPSLSGRSTPLSAQPSGKGGASDSFSSLLALNKSKQSANLSLQERQKQLLAERARQAEEQKSRLAQEAQLWDTLGSGKSSQHPSPTPTPTQPADDDDILSAFKSSAPVDESSHFPAPQSTSNRPGTVTTPLSSTGSPVVIINGDDAEDDDDDPFGLGQMQRRAPVTSAAPANHDDDDILGMLGKPASEVPPQKPPRPTARREEPPSPDESAIRSDGPQDKAVADLVDMGFPVDKAAHALAQTSTGADLQAAVGLLLNQAHEEARQKTRGTPEPSGRSTPREGARGRPVIGEEMDGGMPSWMKKGGSRAGSNQGRRDQASPSEEKDVAQYASEIGTTLFKSANSLWKTGQKKMQRAVADLQQEPDSSQPKWMRDAQLRAEGASREPGKRPDSSSQPPRAKPSNITDEAMLLETGDARPQKPRRTHSKPLSAESDDSASADFERQAPRTQPRFLQQQTRASERSPSSRLSKLDIEKQSAQAYVSPARRKRPTPKPAESPQGRPDSFGGPTRQESPRKPVTSPLQSNNPFASKPPARVIPTRPARAPTPPRPKAPSRQIPPVSASALSSSAAHRQKGTEAYKRGDYATAQSAYTSALNPLPSGHPITIIVLCNRALTSIKTGDPKAAIADADTALEVVGPSHGDGEIISIGGGPSGEEKKDMKEFFGKALMRKAEALEHLEKWTDAAATWRKAVEAGVGGAVSIQGRNRCEKAAGQGKPQPPSAARRPAAPAKRPPPTKPAKSSALSDLSGQPASPAAGSSEALTKLRAANAAAEQADNEKFALTDTVDARLTAWKGTKADNLRALLGSLDTVLWPEAGWTKVGMGDLVMPARVKIVYMKAIAKVHPDKISQSATTEQKMISAAVFAILNEAWDKFKKDNGL